MLHITPTSSHGGTSKLTRLTAVVHKNWTDARMVDRQLIALRTNLSRQSG
jgi:hypothetical protein